MSRVARLVKYGLCLLLSLACVPEVAAAEPEFRDTVLRATDEGVVLDAEIVFDLTPRLEEAVKRGVALYFVLEFELIRPRWYWLDEKIVARSQTWRLSFHALTRKYRLSAGALHMSFDTLDEAVSVMRHVRRWSVAERVQLRPGESYQAGVRFRLDSTQLPTPFQVSAIGSREWTLDSGWQRWGYFVTTEPAR